MCGVYKQLDGSVCLGNMLDGTTGDERLASK